MKRREFIHSSLAVSAAALAPTQETPSALPLPRRDRVRVAFLLGPDTNVIDTAGPWEVFQDTMIMKSGTHTNPFELVTVGPSRDPLTMTAGLVVTPGFTFDDAPAVNVVVIPAQRAGDAARAWLRERAAHADMVMSVCTGAYQLARTGLLDGLAATTHHDFWDDFEHEFPRIRLQRGPRFVDNGRIATSGGLTSGIDLALHVVSRYFDSDTARATARYLEHDSPRWQ
jgi:transcriptional regulator GlxA family with amidase domain